MRTVPVAALILTLAAPAMAQQGNRQPPPAAYAACSGAGMGAACTMTTPRGMMTGTCGMPPGIAAPVCIPARGPQTQGRQAQGGQQPQGTRQGGSGRPPMRQHTTTQTSGMPTLLPATEAPITTPQVSTRIEGAWRVISSNAIADHLTGAFPNSGNPNRIAQQTLEVRVPAAPTIADLGAAQDIREPGWALNGVKFNPFAAEFYQGDPSLGWQYEALAGAVPLGMDENHAHVQPTGEYHYHGLPTLFLRQRGLQSGQHSPLIGWAADGFPIYAILGWQGGSAAGGVAAMTSGWRLKSGARPSGAGQPGGTYDGTFVQDYTYVPGSGTLDECNGMITATPEFPNGTYAYFLTESWPVVPRCVRGKVDASLLNQRRGG